jgi:hypothetical protein
MPRKRRRGRGNEREAHAEKPIRLEVINDEKVRRIPIEVDDRLVKDHKIYPELYYNTFCVAPTWSGKTTAVFKLLQSCVGKYTTIIVFCASLYNDDNWLFIRKYFEEKGINVEAHTGIVEDGVNILDELVSNLQAEAKERDEQDDEGEDPKVDLHQLALKMQTGATQEPAENEEKPKKREKYQTPDYVVVFDDVADQIRTSSYNVLLKYARNFHIRTITSSQDLKDITPASRLQIRVWLIFRGLTEERLNSVYDSLNLRGVSWELFQSIYKTATTPTVGDPRPFLYIAPRDMQFRRNLDTRIIVSALSE